MAPLMKKKYESGEGAKYLTRAKAMRKLQLSLKDFRKLCILKGIYPREPHSRKKAQKGKGGIQTLYHVKDIQFLLHEPIIWKFREAKVHGRKIGRAKATGNHKEMTKLLKDRPFIKLDHIVKERYPTFMDALRDLDDCLTLCFLFSTFPSIHHLPRDQSALCRRLTLEFMHAVIASKALRKVFISIKGYYFQAEIKGVTVTWIIPHHFSFEPQTKEEVDFKIMSTFVQFYLVLLGFVNFRLYSELNLKYPPNFSTKTEIDASLVDKTAFQAERVAALVIPIAPVHKVTAASFEEPVEIDSFNLTGSVSEADEMKKEAERLEKLKNLFSNLKLFLSREVPREPLTFALRCFGGTVSWDKDLFIGAAFSETDETITHQIVDRPSINKQFISRYYVQPQWVFDCINAGELLPVEKYFIGCVLPPHLSPFKEKIHVQYVPAGNDSEAVLDKIKVVEEKQESDDESIVAEGNEESENESSSEEEEETEDESEASSETEEVPESPPKPNKKENKKKLMESMKVQKGKVEAVDPDAKKKEDWQEYKLREKMVQRKHRALYKSMVRGRIERNYDVKVLKRKRRQIDLKKKKAAAAQK